MLRPELRGGVLYAPKRWESPGIIGDGMEPVDRDDPEYDTLLMELPPGERHEALVAAVWDPAEHPRDPGGEGGGQFIQKSGVVAVDEIPQWTRGAMWSSGDLWHATDAESAQSLVQSGFDPTRFGKGAGATFGRGVYLSDEPHVHYGDVGVRVAARFHSPLVGTRDEVVERIHQIAPGSTHDTAAQELLAAGVDGLVMDFPSGSRMVVAYKPDAVAVVRDEPLRDLLAAAWDESAHPRDPGGEGGGEFIEKGTNAEGAGPKMGLGTPEQEADLRKANAVPPLVEQQMEADLKDFLDHADLAMRMPEDAVLEMLDDGEFYNQHQSGGARGLGRTVDREGELLGVAGAAPDTLPKYGYLGPETAGVIGYGPVRVVFKDNIRDRATFTVNDSLLMGKSVIPSPVRDPSYLSAGLSQIDEAMSAAAGGYGIELDYGTGGMNARYGGEDFTPDGEIWSDALAYERTSIPYFEAQIYGKLTPADIDYVEVPPEDDWDMEDPLTGLPQINDKEQMRQLIQRLEDMGIRVGEYELPGDYSGEFA